MKEEKMNLEFEELEKFFVEKRSAYLLNKSVVKKGLKESLFDALDEQCERVFEDFKTLFASSYCSECFDEKIRVAFVLPNFKGKAIVDVIGRTSFYDWLEEWSKRLRDRTNYITISGEGELFWSFGDEDAVGIVSIPSFEEIFSRNPGELKPWDRKVAEAIKSKEEELFYSVYDEVRKRLTEELKPQLSKMAKNLEEKATYNVELGPFHCASRICERVVCAMLKYLQPFSVLDDLKLTDNGIVMNLEIELRW